METNEIFIEKNELISIRIWYKKCFSWGNKQFYRSSSWVKVMCLLRTVIKTIMLLKILYEKGEQGIYSSRPQNI